MSDLSKLVKILPWYSNQVKVRIRCGTCIFHIVFHIPLGREAIRGKDISYADRTENCPLGIGFHHTLSLPSISNQRKIVQRMFTILGGKSPPNSSHFQPRVWSQYLQTFLKEAVTGTSCSARLRSGSFPHQTSL